MKKSCTEGGRIYGGRVWVPRAERRHWAPHFIAYTGTIRICTRADAARELRTMRRGA